MIKLKSVTVKFDPSKLKKKLDTQNVQAVRWLKNEIAKDTEPFVPFKTGTLSRSVRSSVASEDKYLIYNTKYARRLYEGTHFNFNRTKHPQATYAWFEKSKAINLKKWVLGVAKLGGWRSK